MKWLVMSLALMATADAAYAQARLSTVNRSCAANRQSVFANGAIVLGTGGPTYDRFVRDRSFCAHGEFTEPAFVPSRDTDACMIGYRCKTDSWWD